MNLLEKLNEQQQEAVTTTEGPLLILAGAGSGKTRVLTNRTAYLIDEVGINPWHIMAITFTNKAAGEMRERIDDMVGYGSESIWVSTFHSTCVRILRRYIDRLGYDTNFTIYDTDDQKTLMKDICKRLQIDTKLHKEKTILNEISHAKDEMIDPITYASNAAQDYNKRIYAQAYAEYQQELKKNNALDFDDLLVKTVELFKIAPDVLKYYQDRFTYIMVDEYQDTNTVQFEFIRLLASRERNLCVVGDDDQSIYRFRGANIYNILNFEKQYPDAKVIKLEQNYRSTQNILDAAYGVISNNVGRKDKKLWTDKGEGEKIRLRRVMDQNAEAEIVANDILNQIRSGEYSYKDCAVLYRTNAQSRAFEERFIAKNIPYKLIGGTNFYARKEIKDILAYLKTIDNGLDDIAVKRIINVPKRGIGATSISKADNYAYEHETSFYNALRMAGDIPGMGRAAAKIRPFVEFIRDMRKAAKTMGISELIELILKRTGYQAELEAENTDESRARIENISELITKARDYEDNIGPEEEPSLSGFLEQVALVADIDSLDENKDYVVLMTLHSAKGLEFDNVYLTGMEDGLFPSYMSITSDDSTAEIEEERRLAYVGITRAKKHLMITAAEMRMIRGQCQWNKVSRFVKEIPNELFDAKIKEKHSEEEISPSQTAYRNARKYFESTPDYSDYKRLSTGSFGRKGDDDNTDSFGNGNGYGSQASYSYQGTYGDTDSSFGSRGSYTGKKSYGYKDSYGKGFDDASYRKGFDDASYGKGFDDSYGRNFDDSSFGKKGSASTVRSGFRQQMPDDIFDLDHSTTFRPKKEKEPVYTPVSNQKSFASVNTKSTSLSYKVGDRVRHIKFGDGQVKSIIEGGRDYEVTVDFDKAGTKKMFASFAKLKKI